MKNVIIYSTPTCAFCHATKEFFKEHDIKYEEIDVAGNPEKAQEMVEKSGQMGVPVVDIESEIVVGFNKQKLSELLEIK